MNITIAQLVIGFKAAMTARQLADSLGVSIETVRARLRALAPEEEAEINAAMEGH